MDLYKMDSPSTSGSIKNNCVSPDTLPGQRKEDENPPVTGGTEDERKLLNIFPEEIWLKVLGSVNPPDLEPVNNASPFFRRLLYPDRTTFLFSSVWKVLGVQYEYDSDLVYSDLELEYSNLNWARQAKTITFYSVILKLRLVCREWCLAVDKFYEDLYSYDTIHSVLKARVESGLDSSDELKIKREYWPVYFFGHWSNFKFQQEHEVKDFLEHFMATHDSQRNPFSFRKVTFSLGALLRDDVIPYFTRVIKLLTKYGHHIWFCEITISGPPAPPELLIKSLEMLTLMSNLKVLRFNLGSLKNTEFPKCVEEQMMEALVTHPIPRLESLRMVSFSITPRILIEHILEKNDHVEKVEMKRGLEDLDFAQVPLPNLKQLVVQLKSIEEFERLEQCGPLWQLEMLHLDLTSALADYIPDSRIFKCLEQWRNSLTDVFVYLSGVEGDKDLAQIVQNSEMRLDLPNVKRLRVWIDKVGSLDFILPMRNSLELLEYWNVGMRSSYFCDFSKIIRKNKEIVDELKRKEVIQFYSVENQDMYRVDQKQGLMRVRVPIFLYSLGCFKMVRSSRRKNTDSNSTRVFLLKKMNAKNRLTRVGYEKLDFLIKTKIPASDQRCTTPTFGPYFPILEESMRRETMIMEQHTFAGRGRLQKPSNGFE